MRPDSVASPVSSPTAWKAVAPFGGSLLVASVLICNDIIVDGCYIFSVLICPIWFVNSVVRALVQRPSPWIAVARILSPLVTLLLVLVNYSVQNGIATANAADIIRTARTTARPMETTQTGWTNLCRQYLGSIPRAKYCCSSGEFEYSQAPQCHVLRWHPFPLFGRRVYIFETSMWRYVD